MAANKDEGVYEFTRFTGLRNVVDSERLEAEDLDAAVNVDIDDSLEVKRRKGYALLLAGAFSSIWSDGNTCLAVKDGTDLVRINRDWTTTTLATGITGGSMSYARFGLSIGYSNGVVNGMVTEGADRSWGIEPPAYQPMITAVGGWNLPAGRYKVAATFKRADGQESGTHDASAVDVPADGGIAVTKIPVSVDPDVTTVSLYISRADGTTLYHFGDYPNGTLTAEIRGSLPTLIYALETQFLKNPPAGEHVAEFNGHALVAKEHTLYYSEPFAYELFDLRKNFRFLAPITLVAPMETGVYLGTSENVFWLPGKNPEQWTLDDSFDYGAVPGTMAYTSRDMLFKGEGSGKAVVFHSTQGVCVAFDGGTITNITQERFDFPSQDRGAGIVRRHRGFIQYVATLQGAGGAEASTAVGSGSMPEKELTA